MQKNTLFNFQKKKMFLIHDNHLTFTMQKKKSSYIDLVIQFYYEKFIN
jgi:hypothetical protein